MKIVAWLTGWAALAAAGGYSAVYLARWEWSRALWTTVVFVAIEIVLATALVLHRLTRLERAATTRPDADGDPRGDHLSRTRPAGPERFAWLGEQQQRTGVFVTMLIGGGLVISGMAWLADQIGARTLTPRRERALREALTALALPDEPLVIAERSLWAEDVPGTTPDGIRLLVGDTRDLR